MLRLFIGIVWLPLRSLGQGLFRSARGDKRLPASTKRHTFLNKFRKLLASEPTSSLSLPPLGSDRAKALLLYTRTYFDSSIVHKPLLLGNGKALTQRNKPKGLPRNTIHLTFFMRFLSTFFPFFISLILGIELKAQVVADFENIPLATASFLNGSDGRSSFSSGEIELAVDYIAAFDSWSGWAISSLQDNMTPGFNNQYASIAGSGREGSQNYAVSYAPTTSVLRLPMPRVVEELWITNSTYTYYSMLEGDAFAKRFGGETGNDPDFLLLTVRAFRDGMQLADSIAFYLADYRFADNSQDYLLSDWTLLHTASLGVVDSLVFSLSSSDEGDFGMNTPAYFCLDDVLSSLPTPIQAAPQDKGALLVFPNPVIGKNIYLRSEQALSRMAYRLYDSLGRLQAQGFTQGQITVASSAPGVYTLFLETREGWLQRRVYLNH